MQSMLFFSLCSGASAASLVGAGRKGFLASGSAMQPDVVAHTLVKVEDEWSWQTAAFAECNATSGEGEDCTLAPKAFSRSCSKIVLSVVQASSGERDAVQEYFGDVCAEPALKGWRQEGCHSFAEEVLRGMLAEPFENREHLKVDNICSSFWTRFSADDKTRRAKEKAALDAAEQKRREDEADLQAKKKAEEEAAKKAEDEAKKKAEEEAAKKADEEAAKKAEEEAKKKAEEEVAARQTKGEKAKEATTKQTEAEVAAQAVEQTVAAADTVTAAPVAAMPTMAPAADATTVAPAADQSAAASMSPAAEAATMAPAAEATTVAPAAEATTMAPAAAATTVAAPNPADGAPTSAEQPSKEQGSREAPQIAVNLATPENQEAATSNVGDSSVSADKATTVSSNTSATAAASPAATVAPPAASTSAVDKTVA